MHLPVEGHGADGTDRLWRIVEGEEGSNFNGHRTLTGTASPGRGAALLPQSHTPLTPPDPRYVLVPSREPPLQVLPGTVTTAHTMESNQNTRLGRDRDNLLGTVSLALGTA